MEIWGRVAFLRRQVLGGVRVDETPEVLDESLKILVGAKGFEPSTSWSRTKYLNPINAVSGVAYGARNVISPLLVVRNLSVDLSVILRAR